MREPNTVWACSFALNFTLQLLTAINSQETYFSCFFLVCTYIRAYHMFLFFYHLVAKHRSNWPYYFCFLQILGYNIVYSYTVHWSAPRELNPKTLLLKCQIQPENYYQFRPWLFYENLVKNILKCSFIRI